MLTVLFISIVALIAISGFFSASEMAFASLNEARLRAKVEKGGKFTQKIALKVYECYDKALAAILIGNNLANTAASSIATLIVIELGISPFVATAVMTVLLLIFSEITPKTLAKSFSEQFSSFSAIPIRALTIVLTPVIFVVTKTVDMVALLWKDVKVNDDTPIDKSHLESIFTIAQDEGALDEQKSELFINALEFEDTEAYKVMTPRVDMKTFDINAKQSKILDIAYNSRHSRIPVYDDDIDNIIGVLHLNKLFKALASQDQFPDICTLLEKPVFVSIKTTLNDVVNTMKENSCEICIVSDEFGGVAGLITMEDALEELVGEIWDESDEITEDIITYEDGKYIIKGTLRMYELSEELDLDLSLEQEDIDEGQSIGGFMFDKFEEIPTQGASFEFCGYLFTAAKVENHRVETVFIEKVEKHLFEFTRRDNDSDQAQDN